MQQVLPRARLSGKPTGETAERVQAALEADEHLYAKHIFVRADNGVVRLSGYVWDPPDLNKAHSTAELVQVSLGS